ncbi:MAG: DUF4386 domain-containing protein [Candidatus Brocadiales bacterium]|nr:DUF4386 domain-containing protein [Candidatus Brocadiales bacterium]
MKTYRLNSVMAGALYFMGTVFGVVSGIIGGEVLTSIITGQPLEGVDMLAIVAANSSQLAVAAFFTLMMGISLVAMTVFLYPVFRKDSEELATGMLLFRGALEGTYYFITALGFLTLVALGNEYVAMKTDSTTLQSIGNVLYQFQDFIGPVGTFVFLIGATCLYVSFYRTRLIPRWLAIWGLIGVVPYMAYALLHLFHLDTGYGFWLQMVLAPQELVMGAWLVIKGFSPAAVKKLDVSHP